MKTSSLFTTALAAILATGASAPVQAEPMRFACDAPSGRVTGFQIPVDAKRFRIVGTVKPAAFRPHESFTPTATVELRARGSNNKMVMQLVAPSAQAAGANLTLRQINGSDDKSSPVGNLAIGKVVNFGIIYNEGGENQFLVGEQVFTSQGSLSGQMELAVSCSTGDFVFEQLDWGTGE